MEHHAPHHGAAFEGYYSKFDLPSGAHLALIICQVKQATTKPYMVSFTYVRAEAGSVYQRELWPEKIEMIASQGPGRGFRLEMPGIGFVEWNALGTTEYNLEHADFTLRATTTSRVAWSEQVDTPEASLVHLPLPLHWHVQSLASPCEFRLRLPEDQLADGDAAGHAVVHEEKNWAMSFPAAHMWLQARDGERGFCCAGGQILGVEAFLLGYRRKGYSLDFRPPFALRFLRASPFMSFSPDWARRRFDLCVQSFRRKLCVHAEAPPGRFFPLSCPFPEGHRENYLGQSFAATIKIQVFESTWLGPWRLVHEDEFTNASLEFGGAYYPPAGSDQRFH